MIQKIAEFRRGGGVDGAKVNCAERVQAFPPVFRHHRAVLLVVVRAPGKHFYFQVKRARLLGRFLQYFQTSSDHFPPDAIHRDGRNCIFSHFTLLEQTS